MTTNHPPYQLHLLTLRVWQEVLDEEKCEWRGEVKNTSTGEHRYFRDWQTLVQLLPTLLSEPIEYESQDKHDALD